MEQRHASVPEIAYPDQLPIVERRQEFLDTIRENQVVVIAGETGSGKSTQIPKFCLELGRGVAAMIGHTQPRRLAAARSPPGWRTNSVPKSVTSSATRCVSPTTSAIARW